MTKTAATEQTRAPVKYSELNSKIVVNKSSLNLTRGIVTLRLKAKERGGTWWRGRNWFGVGALTTIGKWQRRGGQIILMELGGAETAAD